MILYILHIRSMNIRNLHLKPGMTKGEGVIPHIKIKSSDAFN